MPKPRESSSAALAVRSEYERRLADRRGRAARLASRDRSFSWIRGGIAAGALALWWFTLGPDGIALAWLVVPFGLFLTAVIVHDGIVRRRRRADRSVAFYEAGLARLDHAWAGKGDQGLRFLADDHPFAGDLDLFGKGSLYERLSTVRTHAGEEALAAWLLGSAPRRQEPGQEGGDLLAEARARQAAVGELRDALDLREELALQGDDLRAGIAPETLRRWSTEPPPRFPRQARLVSAGFAALNVATALAWGLGVSGPAPFFLAVLPAAAWALLLHARVERVVKAADRPGRDLVLLAHVLARFEREHFAAPLLVALRRRLESEGLPPSAQVRRLARLQDLVESRGNQLFAPFALPLMWSTQLALAIEAWRSHVGPNVPVWLAAVGELEALCALAGYAYENPDDPFPDLVDGGPLFDAEELGHPLIPESACVRNDVRLGGEQRLLVVSGSNMSGKSTLLRSVGQNVVLAWCGAPVRAARLRVSRLSLGASIRIQDSLQQGSSRFYAEITRLRQIVDLARERPPALFLLDEILHGTNSSDRRVGAEAVLRALVGRGAVGLVTTHDLALARIADDPALGARNVHFEDHLDEGRIAFDFQLKDGVVTKSNAIALMRAVGLEV